MTSRTRERVARNVDWVMNALIVLGVCLAVFALVRDYQTRRLIDQPVREIAYKLCVSDNARWNAYLTAAVAASGRQSPGETDTQYAARQKRTEKIVAEIRRVVTVKCSEAPK